MVTSTSPRCNSLPGLPVELVLIITESLPTPNALALAATAQHFYGLLTDAIYIKHIQTAPVSKQPLWWASQQDSHNLAALSTAKRALSHGAQPDARAKLSAHDSEHDTPLLQAVKNRNTALIQLLLSAGANPVARGGSWSPINLAAHQVDLCSLEMLLASAPDVVTRARWTNKAAPALCTNKRVPEDTYPLQIAAYTGSSAVASLLLSHGAKPDGPDGVRGYSPLYISIVRGHPRVTEILLDAGADDFYAGTEDINIQACWRLAIRLASQSSGVGVDLDDEGNRARFDCLRALLRKRRFPPHQVDWLVWPWPTAILTLFVFKMLYQGGLDVHARSHPTAKTMLHVYVTVRTEHFPVSAETTPEDFVKVLLDHGADVNAVHGNGWDRRFTPLMNAVKYGKRVEMLELLISRGADVTMVDESGRSALDHIDVGEEHKERADAMVKVLAKGLQGV